MHLIPEVTLWKEADITSLALIGLVIAWTPLLTHSPDDVTSPQAVVDKPSSVPL